MGMPAFEADYLFLAKLLQARLLDQVPDVPVDLVETSAQLLAADRRERVLMVLWGGDGFGDEAGAGSSQKVRQRWAVVLGLNNAAKAADARQTVAGPVLSQVHKALAGWAPITELTRTTFKRAPAPLAPSFTPQKALYPLGFEIQLTL